MTATLEPRPAPAGPSTPPPVGGPAAAARAQDALKTDSVAELYARLQTAATGLPAAEAARRLAQVGPNEAAPVRRQTVLGQIVQYFANPLVIILLIASGVSVVAGDALNAAIIVVMVLLSVALNFVQTYRSQQAAGRLRDQVAPTATARRDGAWGVVPRQDLVPGDVIRLAAGDLVPADARLLEARDLHVQQAALTGESLPVEKEAIAARPAPADAAAGTGSVFLGTSVISGSGTALVVATGRATAFGDIAARLATRPPETAFERGTRQFGLLIMRTVVFLVLFVVLVSVALHRDPLESLLFAIALAVGLTPEFLPMITTVTLSQGAVHMARQKVIVKHLEAIQNFGSVDVLCSDKTGTLTSGEMSLSGAVDLAGAASERALVLACVNSANATGIRNPLDAALRAPAPASGDPLDVAILRHDHPALAGYAKLDEVPFDFERRRMSVVVQDPRGARLLIAKGAAESVLACCTAYEAAGGAVQPLDPAARGQAVATYEGLSAQGYRVLAVASRVVPAAPAYRAADEHDLVLAGFLSFADPPLPDAAAALQALRADGVQVKILTGDSELVARHVCAAVGLDTAGIVLGEALEHMSEPALAQVAEQNSIFARVSPAQKDRIIHALKSRSHVVGYMGDGINDTPSLHAADVGISVASAVEVAKDAADIILLERGLGVLHRGILEGRRAFGNVMKYLLMGTSSNFGNMFSMAGAFLFLPFLPMLPTQILLNNFLYDLAQVTIPTDNVDAGFIRRPPRWDIRLIRDFMVYLGPLSSVYDFLTFFVLLQFFHASAALFHTGWFVESLTTQTLVLFIIRTAGNPLQSRPSRPLTITTLAVVVIAIALPFSPLAGPLGFTPLPAVFFLFLAVVVGTYLLLVQIVKGRLMRPLFG